VFLAISVGFVVCAKQKEGKRDLYRVKNSFDVIALFPTNIREIETLTDKYIKTAKDAIQRIIDIPDDKRTFINTAKALDTLEGLSDLTLFAYITEAMELTNPDEAMRKAAHNALIKIQEFAVDYISNNVDLYKALKAYVQHNAPHEKLTEPQQYYLNKTMDDFKRSGLDLPSDKLEEVKKLKKELAVLELDFGTNVSKDNRTIAVKRAELEGLDEDFINSLKKNEEGFYILGIDYPTYFNVMENAVLSETRRKLNELFENRAYPINENVLRQVIAKRDQLASLIGYPSYADLDLSDQMVGSVNRAQKFIDDLLIKADIKEQQEFDQLISDLPEGVTLTQDKKMKPWDLAYAKNQFKKKHYNVDETKIAEYFPMENTIKGLLDIYEKFFSLQFKEVALEGAWEKDVKLIEVYDAHKNQLLGYFLLDLYPRPNKYSHACHVTLVPATYIDDHINPEVSLVIANFPKSTSTKPSLLKLKDVTTFFHEFGHAIHALLGRTKLASLSGTHVKRDFVELPSQMLEEWLRNKDILKQVSRHYKTGEPLPDDLIDRIIELKNFNSGMFLQTQLLYSQLALDLFKAGAKKNIEAINRDLVESFRKNVAFEPQNHSYAAFGHLMGYGAKYYGYMWSKVFALDIFEQIKKHGLLNPAIGHKYVEDVIGKGGSDDPNNLLRTFLGREPNQKAFLKDMGLQE
jgi:thimet oligopeptidase